MGSIGGAEITVLPERVVTEDLVLDSSGRWLPVGGIFCLGVDGKEGVEEVAVADSGERTHTLGILVVVVDWVVRVSIELLLFSRELIALVRHTANVGPDRPVDSSTSVCEITIAVDVELAERLEDAGTDRSLVMRRLVVVGERDERRSSSADPVHGSISP